MRQTRSLSKSPNPDIHAHAQNVRLPFGTVAQSEIPKSNKIYSKAMDTYYMLSHLPIARPRTCVSIAAWSQIDDILPSVYASSPAPLSPKRKRHVHIRVHVHVHIHIHVHIRAHIFLQTRACACARARVRVFVI